MDTRRVNSAGKALGRDVVTRARRYRGETLAQVADALGVSKGTLSRKLNDRYSEALSPGEIEQLVAHLDLSRRDRDILYRCFGHQPTPSNLPAAIGRFIGRAQELAAVARLLEDSRLVTLTGEGGCGKTRLAIETGRQVTDHFVDGVWLVELASLTNPELVPGAVVSALRLRERSGQAPRDLLVDHVRSRFLLLVLDNCEHLLSECASLAESLLRACPGLSVLATSREPLRISGEHVWRVPQLSVPAADDRLTQENAQSFDAVALFLARANESGHAIQTTAASLSTVHEICRRLEGSPLALELAAARLNIYSVQEVAAGLADRFRVLAAASRSAAPRHQSLRHAIEWSYALLTPVEREVFRALGVFMGGFTREAVVSVCSKEDADMNVVLAALVDKSLVRPLDGPAGSRRFTMLETIRAFALDELEGEGELVITRRRHFEFIVRTAETLNACYLGGEDHNALAELVPEMGNLRVAMRHAIDHEDVEGGARLLHATRQFVWQQGHVREHFGWAEALLTLPDAAVRTCSRARLLVVDTDLPARYHERMIEAIAICREVGDQRLLGEALRLLAWNCFLNADLSEAQSLAAEAVGIARELEDHFLLVHSLSIRARVAMAQNDDDFATVCAAEGHRAGERHGNLSWAGTHAMLLGRLAARRGEHGTAHRWFQRALELQDRGEPNPQLGSTLWQWAWVDLDEHQLGQAAARLRDSVAIHRDLGPMTLLASALETTAELAWRAGDAHAAVRLLSAVDAWRRASYVRRYPTEQSRYDRLLQSLRSSLNESAFAAAWTAGRHMAQPAAVALALDVTRPLAATGGSKVLSQG